MNIDALNKAFAEVIGRRGVFRKLKLKKNTVTQYRWRLKTGKYISLDKKLQILQRAGYPFSDLQYSDKDLISLIRFTMNTTQHARAHGAEYVLEKWKRG